jgi:adenine-specific DNA-methyltransferase
MSFGVERARTRRRPLRTKRRRAFEHYDDGLEHSVWLTMMRDRLVQVKQLLSPDGSVWVHLDDTEVAYCRVLLDELFGRENFVTTVIWQKSYTRENRKAISTQHDYLHVYALSSGAWKEARNLLPSSEEQVGRYTNPDGDARGDWQGMPLHAQGGHGTAAQFYSITTPSGRVVEPPPGNCWRVTRPRYEELLADGRPQIAAELP